MMMIRSFFVIALLALVTVPAHALEVTLEHKNAYAYATSPAQKHGAVFLEIINHTHIPALMTSARTDVSERVELHTHIMDDGIMMMREVENFEVPPRNAKAHKSGYLKLKPTGHHIMLMDLKTPLKKGENFDLELSYKNGWNVTIPVKIVAPGAKP